MVFIGFICLFFYFVFNIFVELFYLCFFLYVNYDVGLDFLGLLVEVEEIFKY